MKNRPVSVVTESQVGEGDNLEQPDKITVITLTTSIYYQVQCSSGEHCICFGPRHESCHGRKVKHKTKS